MSKGRVTIPTDANFVDGTKKLLQYWGADAVRDCDGVSLPADVRQFGCDVYKAYFIVREDHEYAIAHKEYWQNVALTTDRITAKSDALDVDLLANTFRESLEVNTLDYKKYWQVIDRTDGTIHADWQYLGNNIVRITNCKLYHEYTVNFFAVNTWDPVQIYNYHVNNWHVPKDIDLDPVYPEALAHMLSRMESWLKSNPDVTVVRFTTFFYNFFIVNVTGLKQRIWDWHCYAMTASPAMFELFSAETGREITLEDIVDGGYYSNRFRIPNPTMRAYVDFVQRKCADWAKLFVDLCHKYGKKAIMFDGDHRIGVEPYSPYFANIGLDGVVGAPSSAIYVQQIANMQGIDFTEGRLNPYFFPNECPGDERGTQILLNCWNSMRRGMLKKPIDRIGFGGYLKQVAEYPTFVKAVRQVCDEFREIRTNVGKTSCKSKGKIAVLSYWGRRDSWMLNGTFVDDAGQGACYYWSILAALAVLPFDVDFLSFDDVLEGKVDGYDIVVSCGLTGTSFHGDKCWANPDLLTAIRRFVDNGGGFVGVGEPSGYQRQGRFIQLSDVLGVERECDFRHFEKRDDFDIVPEHWITQGVDMSLVGFNRFVRNIYPVGATVLAADYDWEYPKGSQNAGNVHFAVNEYGNGRSVYLSGITANNQTIRLLYRAFLWAMRGEDKTKYNYAESADVDVFFYEQSGKYALFNDSDNAVETTYYDVDGNKRSVTLGAKEIKWL